MKDNSESDNDNDNRNLKIIEALLKNQAHHGISLFTSAATSQRRVFQRVVKKNSGPISKGHGGNKVAVKRGVVQMGRVNDQMGKVLECLKR